ncbi:hypothetical protein F4777DRAFT_565181 [Nemania sp. FL0916]|nr:hypothetical protein F4777DRAFT_565181 [Nemania sp. FL0916]
MARHKRTNDTSDNDARKRRRSGSKSSRRTSREETPPSETPEQAEETANCECSAKQDIPNDVQEVIDMYPVINPKHILAISRAKFKAINLRMLGANLYVKGRPPTWETLTSNMGIWAHCFTQFVLIYSLLFKLRKRVVVAMLEFANGIYELSGKYALRRVLKFAEQMMDSCLIPLHIPELWGERKSQFEATYFKSHELPRISRICYAWNRGKCGKGTRDDSCPQLHLCRRCGDDHKESKCTEEA